MPSGKKVRADVLKVISQIYMANRDSMNGKQITHEVWRRLGREKSERSTWPSEVTVRQKLREIRRRIQGEEDEPWGVSALGVDKCQIRPEALPSVLEVWLLSRREGLPFTIREAKWVSRLYMLFERDPGKLQRVAKFYAEEELLNVVSGASFYGPDGPEAVLHLVEEWKGTRFLPEERSQLLAERVVFGHYPKGETQAEQRHKHAQKRGEALRCFGGGPGQRKPADQEETGDDEQLIGPS